MDGLNQSAQPLPEANWIPPPALPSNIVPSGNGSQVKDGSLESPNYKTNKSGWSLKADGTVEAQKALFTSALIVIPGTVGETISGKAIPQAVFIGDATETDLRVAGSSGSSVSFDTNKKEAFKYTPSQNETINRIKMRAGRDAGMTSDIIASIQTDNAGQPSGTILAQVTIPQGDISVAESLVSSPLFSEALELTSGTAYWIVIEFSNTAEVDDLILDVIGVGAETTASYNGSTWTVDTSSDMGLGVSMEYVSGQLFLSEADVTQRAKFDGFVLNDVIEGSEEAQFLYFGALDNFTGLSVGTYYVSNTRGAIASTPGGTSVQVGRAISPTTLIVNI